MRRNLGDSLNHGALEVQLQHHTHGAREAGVQTDREVEREHMAGFEELFQRWKRPRLSRLRGAGVDASWRTERPVNGRILVKEREEDDDAFRDRGPQASVEPLP